MKILYHHRIASKDGQYVHIEELTNALRALGHEIIMVGPTVAEKEKFGSEGGFVPILKRYVPGFAYEVLELGYSLFSFIKLLNAVIKYRPDFIYERYQLFMPAGIWIKCLFNLPMLLEVNAPLFEERSRYGQISLPWLARWSENYVWRRADFLLPVTQVLANKLIREGVARERIEVIPNGINEQRFSNTPAKERAKALLGLSGKFVLGFTGFVREWHRLERVLPLLRPGVGGEGRVLLLVGDGPAVEEIKREGKRLGVLERIIITGVVDRERVAQHVAAFDIALQPDVVDYASPLKLFEYLALGKAIIAPDKANLREIVVNKESALLFSPDDPVSFVNTIQRLCEDEGLRLVLEHNAKQTIQLQKLTWNNNALRVIKLFERHAAKAV